MTSRRDRRADNAARARFKRKTGGEVITHLFEIGTRIEGPFAAIITKAIEEYRRQPSGCCFGCRADFGRGAAFLVCHPAVRPTSAALAVACATCWGAENYLEALSDAAEASLSKLVPGRWLDPLGADTS
jgi:hypothetical protein